PFPGCPKATGRRWVMSLVGAPIASGKRQAGSLRQRDFDARSFQSFHIGLRNAVVCYDVVQGGRFHDQRKAAAAEFTGVAGRNRALSDLYHDPIHLRFLKIWRTEPVLNIESI